MKLLVVEDDLRLMRVLERDLSEAGFEVEVAWEGPKGLEMALQGSYDCILLDAMLPGLDGWEILRRFRSKSSVPVLMLTARGAVDDRVRGLEEGADDYLVKPFHFDELVARVRALTRRASDQRQRILIAGAIELDTGTRTVRQHGAAIELTGREYRILYRLMLRKGAVIPNEALVAYLSTHEEEIAPNTIEVHISRLRKKLGKECIRTIRGLGYTVPQD